MTYIRVMSDLGRVGLFEAEEIDLDCFLVDQTNYLNYFHQSDKPYVVYNRQGTKICTYATKEEAMKGNTR